ERLHHPPAYTAQRVAEFLHVPGKEVAKSVLLRTNEGFALAVLPATRKLDLAMVGQCLGREHVELADEGEMNEVFPDCEVGAMPPFGSSYQMPTVVDESLAKDDQIVFEAQSHERSIRMSFRDYKAIERPCIGRFTMLA